MKRVADTIAAVLICFVIFPVMNVAGSILHMVGATADDVIWLGEYLTSRWQDD